MAGTGDSDGRTREVLLRILVPVACAAGGWALWSPWVFERIGFGGPDAALSPETREAVWELRPWIALGVLALAWWVWLAVRPPGAWAPVRIARFRRGSLRAVLTLAGCAAALGLGEGALRRAASGPPGDSPGWLARHRRSENPALAYEMVPGTAVRKDGVLYEINRNGFRGPEWPQAGECAVMLVGDSVVFGDGVPWTETFAARLDRWIRKRRGGRDWVAALGVGGYGSYQERELVRLFAGRLRPALTVIVFCLNDVDDPNAHVHVPDEIRFPAEAVPNPSAARPERPTGDAWRLVHQILLRRSVLYRRLVPSSLPWAHCLASLSDPASPEQIWLAKQFRCMAEACRAAESDPRLIVLPFRYQLRPGYALARLPQQQVVRCARDAGIEAVDLTEFFAARGGSELFADACHLSAKGHQVLFEALCRLVPE